MLQVQDLRKNYGERILFEDVKFTMSPRERLGLVGRNGSGKTTLLRLITGEEVPTDGSIQTPKNYSVGYLSQHIRFSQPNILEEACQALEVQEGGWVESHRAEAVLMGLGFETDDFDRPPEELSGGFQVRLQLAKVLLEKPNLLLLDEPTNYLDIVSVRWLERFLRAWDGEMIIITHDRTFMDAVTTHTMIIHRQGMRKMEGGTQKLYDTIALEEDIHERTRVNEAKARKQTERFIERFRYKASKARQVQSRVRQLEKQGQKDELENIATLDFRFNPAVFHGAFAVQANDVSFGWTPEEPLFEDLSFSIDPGDRVAIIGKNGRGKTTLLNVLAGELEPTSGSTRIHDNSRLAHFGQNNIDRLEATRTVEEEILAVRSDADTRSARSICGLMMFQGDDALKKVKVLSGGERARVLLGKLLVSPANLLFLDEPTNHLDMESIDALILAIAQFPGAVVIVTHDERVLEAIPNRLVVFDRGKVSIFESGYRDFLERVGWSDEDELRPTRQRTSQRNKKKDRKKRAEILARRSKVLKPLEQKVESLEARIMENETRADELKKELEQLASGDDVERMTKLSKQLSEVSKHVESDFEALEAASTEHREQSKAFEDELEDL